MGGANAGNVASRFAGAELYRVRGVTLEAAHWTKRHAEPADAGAQAGETRRFSLWRADSRSSAAWARRLVAALIQGDCATVSTWATAARYRFDGEAMHQISEDHSYVEEMRRRGKITEADARTHPQKNLITRAVGVEPYVEGDLFDRAPAP